MPHCPNSSPRLTLPDDDLTQHKNAQQSRLVVVEHLDREVFIDADVMDYPQVSIVPTLLDYSA